MIKLLRYYIVLMLLLISTSNGFAQSAMPDTVCIGATKTYRVNDPSVPSTYTWRINGVAQASTTNAVTVTWNNPGTFQITVLERSAAGCDGDLRSGTVLVSTGNRRDTSVTACNSFTWNRNGNTYTASGNYNYISISPNGCADTVTLRLTITPPVPAIRYATITATANVPQQLQARIFSPGDQYTWSPAVGLNSYTIANPLFNYTRTTEYLISIRPVTGCSVVDTLLVNVIQAITNPSDVFIPKAFSPNGDGNNDKLTPLLYRIKEFKYFRIYNRWGQLVFETSTAGEGWDGTFKGMRSGPDVFTWTTEATGVDGRTHSKRGTSVLLK